MILTANRNVNARLGKPHTSAPNPHFLVPGDKVNVKARVLGEPIEGNKEWIQTDEDVFFTTQAFALPKEISEIPLISPAELPPLNPIQFDSNTMSWAHKSKDQGGLGIVDLWNKMGVTGENVNVLVLDTGITSNQNQFIRDGVSTIKANLCIEELKPTVNDVAGHGTNSASIIGATGNRPTGNTNTDNILFGVAPGVNLYIIKFAGSIAADSEQFLAGLKLINPDWPIDIISASFCFDADPNIDDFFKKSIKDNCIVLSALSHLNTGDVIINNQQFPAFYDNVIPVAASIQTLNQIFTPVSLINNLSKTNWIFPGENIKVLNQHGILGNAQQTSIATPFGAGVIALFLSYMKKRQIAINKTTISQLVALINDSSMLPKTCAVLQGNIQQNINICFCDPLKAFDQFDKTFK